MKKSILILLAGMGLLSTQMEAQTASVSDHLEVQAPADRNLVFDVNATGISKTIEFGADLAWANEQNFRRAILFMGLDQIDLVRASFQPTYPLVDGTDLTQDQIDDLNWRLYLINTYVGANTNLALNSDHPWVDEWYVGQPARWTQLIQTTAQAFIDAGHNVVTVGAFNEPDYGWGQGTQQDMIDITTLMSNNSFFDNIRLSGGNTLNCDVALDWYNALTPAGVNEGNTHQLAGSFDGFAHFFETVRANGHHATADEMHNVAEGLVGYEYGMQTGIWWGPADLARGEMVKAFDGERLGYAEHRNNWTAAAVYRMPDGKIKAFGGTSERQAVTTSYNFISKDRVVYFDGYGPYRFFNLEMPGGTGYQNGQSNAERVMSITWGEDIQPAIDGRYKLVNRASGKVMEVSGDINEANIYENDDQGLSTQLWDVTPVDERIGGDFSYFRIKPASSTNRYLDLYGYSLDNGGKISLWDIGYYGNQQWYLEYAEDGWFYIRSRESSHCAEIDESGNLIQWEKTGENNQQWRLIPEDATVEFTAPAAPQNLSAAAQANSIKLSWSANSEDDVEGYTILRSDVAGGPYETIARGVAVNTFADNTVTAGVDYYYVIKAVDQSLNQSDKSSEVTVSYSETDAMLAHLSFDGDAKDLTENLNHGLLYGGTFVNGKVGTNSLELNGSSDFVQLPFNIANHNQLSISTWVNWAGFDVSQHLFNFSSGEGDYIYLSPSVGGQMVFGVVKDDIEQTVSTSAMPNNQWVHVTVTIGDNGAMLYLNGSLVAESTSITIRPDDIQPIMNYIGVNPSNSKMFEGRIDDFILYNYQLAPEEVATIYESTSTDIESVKDNLSLLSVWPVPANEIIQIIYNQSNAGAGATVSVYDMGGALVKQTIMNNPSQMELNVSDLSDGIYFVRVSDSKETTCRKIVIKH